MPFANSFAPNRFWPNQILATLQTFNSARSANFSPIAAPGGIWFNTDTSQLFIAVVNPNQFFRDETDSQNVTRIWQEGLNVIRVLRAGVPTKASVGNIYLTTDTLEAFAGSGISVIQFRLDVRRALRGAPVPSQVGLISSIPQPVFYVALDE